MRSRHALITLGLALVFALTVPGSPATSNDDEAAYQAERITWIARFDEARARVATAQERRQDALDDYTRMRHRRRQRGAAAIGVKNELTAATIELDAAESNLASLNERARRKGIPKGWMRASAGHTPAAPANAP